MGAAAVIIARRDRETVDAFRRAGAVSAEHAQPLYAIGLTESHAVARLRRRAVLREASPGAWYLDEPSWEAARCTRRRLALAMIAIALIVAGFALFVGGRGG